MWASANGTGLALGPLARLPKCPVRLQSQHIFEQTRSAPPWGYRDRGKKAGVLGAVHAQPLGGSWRLTSRLARASQAVPWPPLPSCVHSCAWGQERRQVST